MVAPISWRKALNPGIYLITALPVISVLTLSGGKNAGWVCGAGAAVILLQHGINVLNDVTDWRRGADVEKSNSWIRFHRGNLKVGAHHGWGAVALGITLGLITVIGAGKAPLLLFALPLVGLGISYNNGKKPLSYSALGEWVTGLCCGPGVAGSLYWIAEGRLDWVWLCLVASYGLLSVGILLSHQPPQVLTDSLAGKRSFAVRHGAKRTAFTAKVFFVLALFFLCLVYEPKAAVLLCVGLVAVRVMAARVTPRSLLMGATQVVTFAAVIAFYTEVLR